MFTIFPKLVSISSSDLNGGLDECCEILTGATSRTIHLREAGGPAPFYRSNAWIVPGLMINRVHASQIGLAGGPSMAGRDDLLINIPIDPFSYRVTQAGRECVVEKGAGATSISGEAYTVTSGRYASSLEHGRALTIVIDRSFLKGLVSNEDAMVAGGLHPNSPAVPLLINYALSLCDIETALSSNMADKVVQHSAELIALALGPTGYAKELAQEGSLSAARLARAQLYIQQHLSNPGLADADIAAFLGVSISLIRKDFENAGLSLARYIRQERIRKAADFLTDPFMRKARIIDIAFMSGFSDVSTFNRAFFRQFGCSPREFRMEHAASGEQS